MKDIVVDDYFIYLNELSIFSVFDMSDRYMLRNEDYQKTKNLYDYYSHLFGIIDGNMLWFNGNYFLIVKAGGIKEAIKKFYKEKRKYDRRSIRKILQSK